MHILMLTHFFSAQGKVVLELSPSLEEPTGSWFSQLSLSWSSDVTKLSQ